MISALFKCQVRFLQIQHFRMVQCIGVSKNLCQQQHNGEDIFYSDFEIEDKDQRQLVLE